MEFADPEKVGWKLADATFSVGGAEFLLVIEEGGSKTALGVIVHFLGTDLEFDNLLVWRDDGGVEGLVTVLFWHGDIVLDAAVHWVEFGMNNTKNEIAGRDVFDDESQSNDVVDAIDVLIVFGELFVQGIDGFDATVAFVLDAFGFESLFDGRLSAFELFVGAFEALFGDVFELVVALAVEIVERGLLDFDANVAHLKTVGKRSEDFERFAGDFLLFVWTEGTEGAEVVEAVGEFDDKNADVLAGGDEEFEEVIAGFWQVFVEIFHAGAGFAEFGDAIDDKGDVFAELVFDVFESKLGVFDGVMEDAGNDGVFVHVPVLEDFHDGERVNDVWLTGFAKLAFVGFGGDADCVLEALGNLLGFVGFGGFADARFGLFGVGDGVGVGCCLGCRLACCFGRCWPGCCWQGVRKWNFVGAFG